jgi:hypothetical protein
VRNVNRCCTIPAQPRPDQRAYAPGHAQLDRAVRPTQESKPFYNRGWQDRADYTVSISQLKFVPARAKRLTYPSEKAPCPKSSLDTWIELAATPMFHAPPATIAARRPAPACLKRCCNTAEYLNQLTEVQLSGVWRCLALRNFQHFIGTPDAIEQQRAVARWGRPTAS